MVERWDRTKRYNISSYMQISSDYMYHSLGRDISDKELGIIVTQIRKYLSTSFIRAQSLCLINRLSYLGEGAQAAAGRRQLAARLEEGRRRDRQAHHLAHVRGQGLSRAGQIFVP